MFTLIKRLALTAAFAAMPFSAAQAQDVTLRLHQFLPLKASIPELGITPWIEKVEAESNGRIKIEHFPSMQLGGKPPALYDQAKDGVVDIIWTVLGYTPGRFPKTEAFELPFMAGDAEGASRAFHEYVEANAMDEFTQTRPIALHVHGPGWLHSNVAIQTLDDVNGQKLRGPTRVTNNLLEKLGATPVGMPVPAVPESVSKGIIDGAVIPWEVTLPLKMSELTKHHAGFVSKPGLYTATFVMTMNNDSYNSLPDDLKAVIDNNSGPETAALFGAAMDKVDKVGRAVAEKSGNGIVELDGEKARWVEIGEAVTADWIAEMTAKGIDGATLVADAKARIAKYAE
ncbi:MAG: TRAP transporter substrate-binding protein [Litoreibacter sp.]|nr:TRAP transporter substrate-binding protein [Litoreibacter sp.]